MKVQRGNRRRAGAARLTRPAAATADAPGAAGRATKYNARGRHVRLNPQDPDCDKQVWCASDAEATRAEQLIEHRDAGRIENLRFQPRFELVVRNRLITTFRPDFMYTIVDGPNRYDRVEEVKGMIMEDYRLRLLLFEALHDMLQVTVIKPGQIKGSRAEWIRVHWAGKLANWPLA